MLDSMALKRSRGPARAARDEDISELSLEQLGALKVSSARHSI